MQSFYLDITDDELQAVLKDNDNMGKNSHVGNVAVALVKLYFLSQYSDATFAVAKNGADLEVSYRGKTDRYEVKGTVGNDLAWQKLKVSSQDCYECLKNGMTLIRVTGVGSRTVGFHFLKFGEDFDLVPEVRYAVKPIRKPRKPR